MSKDGKIREPALQRLNLGKGKSKSKGWKVAPTRTGNRGNDYFEVRTQPRIKKSLARLCEAKPQCDAKFLVFLCGYKSLTSL